MKKSLFILTFLIYTGIFAQPGPSTIRVSFNLPSHYSKASFPKNTKARLSTYLNGKQKVSSSGRLYFNALPTPYSREIASVSVDGHPTGIDLFDSVAVQIILDGVTYKASGSVSNNNSLFIEDFSGEYSNPIISFSDYTVPTRYVDSRPNDEELRVAIQQSLEKTFNSNGPYLVILNSDQQRISSALVICNGDTLPQTSGGLYVPENWLTTKKRIEIYHPDYPSLVLDSCIPPIQTVYLLKEHEPYYVDVGVKHPLKFNNHQKIALRFELGITQETMDSCIQEICTNQHYSVAYHYPDSLKVHNEMLYGGVADLNRIVLLKRRTPTTIGNSYHRQFNYFKNNFPIEAIFRPVNHSTFLNNEVSVFFKEGTSEKTIKQIEKQFNFHGLRSKYQFHEHPLWIDYQLDVFITPNYLIEQLMKNEHIEKAIIGKVEYTTYG